MPLNIGIIGGSFDPIHYGHLIIADCFVEEFGLHKCIFIPTFITPLKAEDYVPSGSQHRLAMVKIAIEDDPVFEADDFEIKKGGTSYTYQTLEYLVGKYGKQNFYLLIGGDRYLDFHKWKRWEWILKNASIVVARRFVSGTKAIENQNLQGFKEKIFFLNNPVIEISSTMIREKVKKGQSIRYLLPPRVGDYIISQNLYR